ncbi:TPA: hypothetical protein RPW09_001653 [Campylobacter fetus subsp. venerealis]|nr:hypothetical protein [Campylobacter fetus subsp. venerealis]HDX6242637.1 hypothetical protein [Campylobacter fetus subsp. venerealis]HDX6244564.1 hypothetical protein [Campylobacter fetus subsp. venerealis]HDX6246569.1 hypothetical protein [Campylobacter fetus subsp. venerealis]HDX6250536.1 hypothetical protein [Campylobacter fetus subsp. venerealis]
MQKFIKTLDNIISKERLSSYSSIDEHCKNLRIIAILTPTIAMIEISIRNIVDFYFKQIYGTEWIKNSVHEQILLEKESIDRRFKFAELSHDQYLSNFSFGKIIYLAKENHLQTYIFENLNELDFRDFSDSNRNFFFFNDRKNDFSDIDKADILLSLLLTIRNRCYHWENILKIRSVNNQTYPRITHRLNNTNIGIMPKELKKFLSDVLNKFIGII